MKKITRKEFIKLFGKVSGGVAFSPIVLSLFQSCGKPNPYEPFPDGTLYFSNCSLTCGHGAQFDQDGNVLNNPDTGQSIASLTIYETSIVDNNIIIGEEGESGEIIPLSDHPELENVGGVSSLDTIDIEPNGILLYHKSENNIIALSRTCTHEGCTIEKFQQP